MTDTPSSIARTVLTIEARALMQLSEELPQNFDEVVSRLLRLQGRVIVSGMGKSGHVANKIAATLASTGTPAQAIHPAEASHGDLGMITKSDAVILISNSGETKELVDIIAYCTRFDIPLVAMTKRSNSTLARAADHVLQLPDVPEACALQLAPTTSTTLSMALGDALAVALMQHRGFDRETYHSFHPGGTLGAQLLRVSAIMHRNGALPIVSPDTPMGETLVIMSTKGFGVAAVIEAGILKGIITDGDLRRNLDGLTERTAGDVATYSPHSINPDALLTEALALMNAHKISTLMVTDEGFLLGLVHIHDLLRAGVA
ncbi:MULTISPECIES: KpsF/GutQ family sugar-phosphate isomerase [Marivita]|jgi:arabinose-5-phosphate isomerase|uniref:KpsF/GutQ family sugar-phosphate isomerase n=1 Tax=Marivita cryptomonadis TaxID=505252 RepID=A0A9Q2S273_9RHOB|nr:MULTISPECIES: KpsF/GutQ family sugar-phosphate isomerase [Marivita]MBM2324178.1 KpsF/GutQ family sugar-phosphate isomerase [Marivita cryptomonadis]MBM2333768.1 KpsF/GutQ family sugar-phosphate isomerase [Marivita cryptomonadis]MBM2343345.1 KpsF/GutQ family sugar-phosphate isomerase [Marivita cryptomonadis]MBM2348017.1 KpsF/GutQ family sugar-phosphate isomerase [Marivita cryptomonadis]MBM2352698.1 KpsF/GutQ family sugar-phosphate isomerase [Marivita cryptomonadis]